MDLFRNITASESSKYELVLTGCERQLIGDAYASSAVKARKDSPEAVRYFEGSAFMKLLLDSDFENPDNTRHYVDGIDLENLLGMLATSVSEPVIEGAPVLAPDNATEHEDSLGLRISKLEAALKNGIATVEMNSKN